MTSRAQNEAERLLQACGVTELPVSLRSLLAYLGIKVKYYAPLDTSGCFAMSEETKTIMIIVNDSLSLVQQRYTAAHELGHLRLHCKSFNLFERKHFPNSQIEIEADLFARSLLMPCTLLIERASRRRSKRLAAKTLASLCKVPLFAAKIRVAELGWTEQKTNGTKRENR